MDVGHFVEWLCWKLKPTISPQTWHLYKSATLFGLTEDAGGIWPDMHSEQLEQAFVRLSNETQAGTARPTGTSHHKMKRLCDSDLVKLVDHFANSKSPYAMDVVLHLQAGRLVGTRPIETFSIRAKLGGEQHSLLLRVKNAKFSSLREHGEFRHIAWNNLPNDSITTILEWLVLIKKRRIEFPSPEAYSNYLGKVQSVLANASRQIWPRRKKHICLYSARHHAAAIWKLYLTPCEVAALMGHAVDNTAYIHYAGVRGSTASRVKPLTIPIARDSEVQAVRKCEMADKRNAYLAEKIQRSAPNLRLN